MLELFEAKAEAVSAEVLQVPSPAAAVDAVLGVLEHERVADAPGARAVWCGCMLQIGGGLDRAGDAVKARHVAGLIADRLVPGPRARRP